MSQGYVPGPALLYLAGYKNQVYGSTPPQEGAPSFLGTCEVTPKVIERPHLQPWFNSLRGKLPSDHIYHGTDALVVADVNRHNASVMAELKKGVRAFQGSPVQQGTDLATDVGSMMVHERRTHILYVYFPYSTKPQYAGMRSGYRFLFAQLMGPNEHDNLGPEPEKHRLIWYANSWLNLNVRPSVWTCYDNNLAAVANLGIN